jgi:hypothetical protein
LRNKLHDRGAPRPPDELQSSPGGGGIPAKHVRLIWPKVPGAYRKAQRRYALLYRDEGEFGVVMKYIDMGGGSYGRLSRPTSKPSPGRYRRDSETMTSRS